uniref:Uncharacterized protein n=1 Tax=Oryza glumipatula TaxID=40148 RepID=A0A0E0BER6_9ORYZ
MGVEAVGGGMGAAVGLVSLSFLSGRRPVVEAGLGMREAAGVRLGTGWLRAHYGGGEVNGELHDLSSAAPIVPTFPSQATRGTSKKRSEREIEEEEVQGSPPPASRASSVHLRLSFSRKAKGEKKASATGFEGSGSLRLRLHRRPPELLSPALSSFSPRGMKTPSHHRQQWSSALPATPPPPAPFSVHSSANHRRRR